MKKIHIVNGPNISHLHLREPEYYKNISLVDIENALNEFIIAKHFTNIDLAFFQSNSEGDIIKYLLDNLSNLDALIINPAAYSHYSLAISDTLAILKNQNKVIAEVHISNIFGREEDRKVSITAKYADIIIIGAGVEGYKLALEYISER
ncbi:MAG: 3-dehydroquinate dehydratase [Spirochaetes bacterium]|nr:3-dehydroquinate dehydratase [Spirochaetota bacterium]NLJ05095.1 3-dehydroquinate dehydratase [Exilispira sp.]MBP8991189.1 3-dehydroquinate dehydratase [Spirochaetota bacterium]HPO60809.1 type II 3-dehydroquinate dehydratase [Exilispira sp.]HQM88913.1 type II 3-dehydroquinate dehydratase [Exilispira sp.]